MRHIAEQFAMPFTDEVVSFDYEKIPGRGCVHIKLKTRRHAICGWGGYRWKKMHYKIMPEGFPLCLACSKIAKKKGVI